MLMHSDLEGPTIIGGDEYVTVDELVQTVIAASGKEIHIEHVEGPVGVQARNFKSKIKSLGWEAKTKLREDIAKDVQVDRRAGKNSARSGVNHEDGKEKSDEVTNRACYIQGD